MKAIVEAGPGVRDFEIAIPHLSRPSRTVIRLGIRAKPRDAPTLGSFVELSDYFKNLRGRALVVKVEYGSGLTRIELEAWDPEFT